MKRIYLLMIAFVAFAGSAFAQASIIDLELGHLYSKTGGSGTYLTFKTTDTVVIDGVNQVYLGWTITNHGPSDVKTSDTMVVVGNITKKRFIGKTSQFTPPHNVPLKKDSSISIFPKDPVVLQAEDYVTASGAQTVPWCDSIWAIDSVTGNVIQDNDTSNNKVCTNVTILFYLLDVNGTVKKGSDAFILYPNPATQNLNIKFDFGANTPASLRIVDLTGKVVYTQNLGVQNGVKDIPLHLTKIPEGLYMVQLTTDKGTFTDRLTIY